MKLSRDLPSTDSPMVDWALYWASRGWVVFPVCYPGIPEHKHSGKVCTKDLGKGPLIKWKEGSTQESEIRRWWTRWPSANIGGTPPADHFVADIDGELDDGVEFPPTQVHKTGKGTHRVYRQPLDTDKHLKQTQRGVTNTYQYWTNVDTRVSGEGYIVLPPSLHVSGVRYEFVGGEPVEFPAELVPEHASTKPSKRLNEPKTDEVVRLLTLPRTHEDLGDAAMATIAGWVARYVPTRNHFDALLWAINAGLAEPMDETALHKKRGIWDKHQAHLEAERKKTISDESRGWLFELGNAGYDTGIENRDGSIEYMPVTDFRLTAKGVVVSPNFDRRMFIVDCHRSDGTTLENQKLDTDVMIDTTRLKKWLARRGMSIYDNRRDPRTSIGGRLLKMLESQKPAELASRDFYGWCEDTDAFLIGIGEITTEGLRPFTKVYPEDKLVSDAPVEFRFDADLAEARDWFKRLLALQPELQSAKIGAWAMMLMLRGQWKGLLPGLLVEAFAGTGKTTYFQLLSKLLGSTNMGERPTHATMRDKLVANTSGFVWLDDIHLDEKEQQLMRTAITDGKLTHKVPGLNGTGWDTVEKQLRASIVVSGEGTDWFRQKAFRDRFIQVEFDSSIRTDDAEQLIKNEDVGRGSGALLVAILQQATHLDRLTAEIRKGVTDRDDHARTTLRIGARILDAVLGTGTKWTQVIDAWYFGDAIKDDLGHASEVVLNVLPTLWTKAGFPMSSGQMSMTNPLWYDAVSQTFWVSATQCAHAWNDQRNVNGRQRQLTSENNITRELDACGAGPSTNKPTKSVGGKRTMVRYRQLPKKYSDIVMKVSDYAMDDD